MTLGRANKEKPYSIWIPYNQVPLSPGHPFYEKLNEVLAEDGFDRWVEDLCSKYFREKGRRSIPPGVYFRMLMIGYFEGIMSERAIAWPRRRERKHRSRNRSVSGSTENEKRPPTKSGNRPPIRIPVWDA